ncbi:hypothetical protein [Selenomonas ruminantium]|uniref:hypothetical protein n=1 Tax=Selenomonas ruminantium TaxID=971 RepID=UPI0026EFD422|nr:hypothetical protein [Selenomonas ruminantium]
MYDVRNILARNNAIGRGAYASTTGAGVAEELFDEDGFSYKELLQEYSGDQKKSSKRQSDSNRNRQQDNNHSQSLSLRSYSKRNTASASELLNGLALKNNAYIQTIGTAASLSNTKLSSSESNAKSEDMSTNKVVSKVDTLSPDSDVYFNDVTVLRSAPSEANRENWLAGYAGKATLVSTSEADGVQWAAVRTGSGKLAYVRTDELSAANPLVTATGSRDKRNVDIGTMLGVKNTVKLYKDTDEQSDYSGDYGNETGLEVLERKIKNGEEWVKVKTYSNDVGWCKAEQLCPLEEKLHTINNSSGDGYKLNLNVGAIPRSMIPSDLNVDADGNIECKISAAYLKNSVNAHVFYDESGIAHGTRGAEAFDLSELDKTDIVGTAGFTPDGWVNFKLSDGRTITINMADLDTNIETGKTNNENNIKDLIINNRPDLFGPNWTILGPTEKGSLLDVNEYSTTKADFSGNVSPAENGLDILVPVKDNNGKEYNVPIKLKVDEYDDGYILSLNVPKEEIVDEDGNKFRVDFDRGIRNYTLVSFDKDGNFDNRAISMSINVRYGDSNDYQKIGLDFSGLNIIKNSNNISVNTNGFIKESIQKNIPSRESIIEDIVDEKIENAQTQINKIKVESEASDSIYEKDTTFKYIGNGVKTVKGNYYFNQCSIYNTRKGDDIYANETNAGDQRHIVVEMNEDFYSYLHIPRGSEYIVLDDNSEVRVANRAYGEINIKNSAYVNINIGNERTRTNAEIYALNDVGLDIKIKNQDNDISIYGSDYNDKIVFEDGAENIIYYAGIGENTVDYNKCSEGNRIYANQGINTINLNMTGIASFSPKIKGGGINTYNILSYYSIFEYGPVEIEDFSSDDTIVLGKAVNQYDLKITKGLNGEVNICTGQNNNIIASLSGDVDFNGKIKGINLSGKSFEVTIADLIAPIGRNEVIERIHYDGEYYNENTNTRIELISNEKSKDSYYSYVEMSGYKLNNEMNLSEVNMMDEYGDLKITDAKNLKIKTNKTDSIILDGSAIISVTDYKKIIDSAKSISVTDGKLLVKTEDNVSVTIIDNNATVMTKGGDNKIKLEGKNNILYMGNGNNELEITNEKAKVTTSGGMNKIDIRGKEAQIVLSGGSNDIKVFDKSAHIHCGNGEDSITIKSTGTTISNFDFDKDKLNFGSYSELEADIQGRSIVVRGKDSNSEDFVVSLLGTTDIDKIQKLIEEHNENVQKDEMSRKLTESYASLENSLAEKIGTAIKNDVEPVFKAKDALKQIDKIGKIEGNTHLPQNVIDRYKEYIAESMANSAITADDLTNTERIVNSWASIFGDNKEIPIGEYTIVPTAFSYNGIGAFKADVKKDGKYVTTLYMANLDNKALSEAVTDFIAAGQKVYKSKLNEAIKSYVDEVGDAFGVNLGEAYDVGVGVINLLSGGDAGKSKFSDMLNSFGQKNVEKLIERTFGKEGKNMVKAVKSLKEAKDNIDTAINTANLTDYEKITGLLNATAKLIGKL